MSKAVIVEENETRLQRQVNVKLTEHQWQALKAKAREYGLYPGSVAKRALHDYLFPQG